MTATLTYVRVSSMPTTTMTTSQVAHLFEVSTNTILRWAVEDGMFGEFETRPSGHRRFYTEQVLAAHERRLALEQKLREAKAAQTTGASAS